MIITSKKTFDHVQILLSFFFIVFLIAPFRRSHPGMFTKRITSTVQSHLGIVFSIILGIVFFRYANPLFAILYFIFAYVLIQRCAILDPMNYVEYAPIDKFSPIPKKTIPIINNSVMTLEEQTITKFAPIGDKLVKPYIVSEFKPMLHELHSASYNQ